MFGTCYLVCHVKHCDAVELSTLESPFKKEKSTLESFSRNWRILILGYSFLL